MAWTWTHRILRIILFMHGLLNVFQGLYCIFYPYAWVEQAGATFRPSTSQALQSIGLGSLGVGVYSTLGAYKDDRTFYVVTFVMRLVFAILQTVQWGWTGNEGVIVYEGVVALIADIAAATCERKSL